MAEDEDPLLGRTIGGYRVEHLLSRGPRFCVYRAMQLSVSRRVAIKVARSSSTPDKKELLQFVEKARFAASRTHPRLVQLHDVRREARHLFYSMEFLPGGNLAGLISRTGPIAWETAITLLRDGASALVF